MRLQRLIATVALVASVLAAQQQNTVNHSMTINGVNGPPWPITTNNVRTSLPANFLISGFANQPYAIFQGNLGVGTTIVVGSIVDLALNPFPALVIDGFQNPAFKTDAFGVGAFSVQVPGVGVFPNGVPLGFTASLQALMGDPANSPWGLALTAATKITVVQGPIVTLYSLGDESVTPVTTTGVTIPFYGTNYTSITLCSNGYVTMGSNGTSDFTPTDFEMNSGPPRVAPMWSDLDCPFQTVKTTLDSNPGNGNPGFIKVEYTNITSAYVPQVTHTFSLTLKADGNVEIHSAATNNPSVYDSLTGFGPGNNLGTPQTQKNFVGPQPPGSSVGPGILTTSPFALLGTVNMSFFEWFGIIALHAYYGNPYDNPFDLFALTIHGQPAGSGTLPGLTNQYVVY